MTYIPVSETTYDAIQWIKHTVSDTRPDLEEKLTDTLIVSACVAFMKFNMVDDVIVKLLPQEMLLSHAFSVALELEKREDDAKNS